MKRLLTALVLISGGISVARATVANVSADAHVTSTLPNTNFGTRSNLAVNATSSALVQFDFSSLPGGTTGSQVSKAVLYVYVNRMNAAGSITIAVNTSAWSEFAVTSATAPTNSGAAAMATVSAAGSYVPVDITTLVQGWVTTPASNYGITLTSGGADVLLDSKENDLTGHAAYIDITLATTGTVGPQGPAGPQGATGPQGPAGQGFSSTLAATPNGFNPMTVTTPTGGSTALNQPALLAFDGTYLHEFSPANSTSVAFTPTGAYAYTQTNMPNPIGVVSDGSALFAVNNQGESNLIKTIASSGAGGGTDSLNGSGGGLHNAGGITFDGTYVVVDGVISSGPYAYQVNPSTLANTKFALGCSNPPQGIGFDGTYYVVICPGQGGYTDILYLYTTAGKLATYGGKDIELLWNGPGGATQCVASTTNFTGSFFASDGVYEWVSCYSGSTAIVLTRYNLTTYFPSGGSGGTNVLPDLTTLLPSGHVPGGLAFDGRYMWIADTTGGTVVEVDPAPATPTVVRTVPAGTHPYGLVFDGSRVWAADYGTGSGTGGVIRLP